MKYGEKGSTGMTLGVGVDIVEVLRIAKMIERHGDMFLNRVFTPQEVAYCSARKAATQHYAGRWAAKEAVLKALGAGWSQNLRWQEIELLNEPAGRPLVRLSGGARLVADRLGVGEVLVSVSHCRTHAVAYATAIGK
jgi:holo-[acyl-carrier protein] synthase